MATHTFNTRIVLKNVNKRNKIGTISIEIVFYHKITKVKKRRYVNTLQKLSSDDYYNGKIKVLQRTKKIRNLVDRKKIEIDEYLRELELKHKDISPDIYDKSIVSNKYENNTVDELFELFLKYQELHHEPLTVKKHRTLKNLLDEFIDNKKMKKLHLSDIDEQFYKDFTDYLLYEKEQMPSTVNKYQRSFKAFMGYLTEELNLNEEKIHKRFKTLRVNNDSGAKVVLLKRHIEKLKKWETDNEKYDLVRDLFLFQVLTGLRYSDLVNVTRTFVINNTLSFVMYKTNKRASVPLHPYALRIMEKYNYELGAKCKTLQNYNKDLKIVCKSAGLTDKIKELNIRLNKKVNEEAELWEKITTHVGRTTFITSCLIAGISPFIVMQYTGHKKIDTLTGYMRIAGTMTTDAFQRFENYIKL